MIGSSASDGSGGLGTIKSRYVNGVLIFFSSTGTELFRIDPSQTGGYIMPGMLRQLRTRLAIATVNGGATLLAALVGFKYRLVFAKMISVGGAAGAVTTVDILATLAASSRKLVAFAQASLVQSAVLTDGGAGAAVLADGASYTANDANTAVTIGITGSNITTATSIDVSLGYVIEP